ncbi:hypothetical protein OA491_02785 [Alphaproteobacteria bacterium]|nr:hypothetical protein [Alphaproteobacteria bacterium]
MKISEQDIIKAQELWAENIIKIGKIYLEKGDYKDYARKFVKNFYAYDIGKVLFKPTLASKNQFRNTLDDALSYFVKGSIQEDEGFALKCWDNIRYEDRNIIILDNYAIAMGNYFFKKSYEENEIKVEYTFGYTKNNVQHLVINLHHSSLPFKNN